MYFSVFGTVVQLKLFTSYMYLQVCASQLIIIKREFSTLYNKYCRCV